MLPNAPLHARLWPEHRKIILATSALIGFLLVADGVAAAADLTPTEIKVLTMLKIIDGTEWPEGSFFNPDEPLVLGVVGADPFGESLDALVPRGRYRDRAIEVRRYASLEDVMPCHVLVVGELDPRPVEDALALVSGLATLTFGESPDFVRRGGMVSVRIEGRRMKYEVNEPAAEREGLGFSEKVLTVARQMSE